MNDSPASLPHALIGELTDLLALHPFSTARGLQRRGEWVQIDARPTWRLGARCDLTIQVSIPDRAELPADVAAGVMDVLEDAMAGGPPEDRALASRRRAWMQHAMTAQPSTQVDLSGLRFVLSRAEASTDQVLGECVTDATGMAALRDLPFLRQCFLTLLPSALPSARKTLPVEAEVRSKSEKLQDPGIRESAEPNTELGGLLRQLIESSQTGVDGTHWRLRARPTALGWEEVILEPLSTWARSLPVEFWDAARIRHQPRRRGDSLVFAGLASKALTALFPCPVDPSHAVHPAETSFAAAGGSAASHSFFFLKPADERIERVQVVAIEVDRVLVYVLGSSEMLAQRSIKVRCSTREGTAPFEERGAPRRFVAQLSLEVSYHEAEHAAFEFVIL